MIRIERPPKAPDVLQRRGEEENRANCESYDNHSCEYRSGSIKFEFNKKIYAHDSVKRALEKAQHCKCCYCESKYKATSWGAVEHFRPKGAVQQEREERGRARKYPGYYWLAYRWENLLVTCESCNTSKGAIFPLSDPKARARSHHDELDAEHPLLVDPASEDPREHIRFRGSASEPISKEGVETIRVLGLNKSNLEEKRREKLDILKASQQTIEIGEELDFLKVSQQIVEIGEKFDEYVEKARNRLKRAVLPDAEYSSMAQCFLEPDNGRDDPR